jgi:hypothetical protein
LNDNNDLVNEPLENKTLYDINVSIDNVNNASWVNLGGNEYAIKFNGTGNSNMARLVMSVNETIRNLVNNANAFTFLIKFSIDTTNQFVYPFTFVNPAINGGIRIEITDTKLLRTRINNQNRTTSSQFNYELNKFFWLGVTYDGSKITHYTKSVDFDNQLPFTKYDDINHSTPINITPDVEVMRFGVETHPTANNRSRQMTIAYTYFGTNVLNETEIEEIFKSIQSTTTTKAPSTTTTKAPSTTTTKAPSTTTTTVPTTTQPVTSNVLGTVIRFDGDYVIGAPDNPITHELNIDYSGFENGEILQNPSTVTIYHHSSVEPKFIKEFAKTGNYSTTYRTLNVITITFKSKTDKRLSITNISNSTNIDTDIPRRNLVWEGLRRNANIAFASDTSTDPIHGVGNIYKMYSIVAPDGNIGFGISGTSSCSCFVVPNQGKISLKYPFAFSFWAKYAGDEHPFRHYSEPPVSNAIRFLGFGYESDGGNGGNGFQILTESATDRRIKARFLLGTSTSTNRQIIGPSGDVNFELTDDYKHIFVWYDGTTLGMTINNQHTITKSGSSLLNFNTNHNSDFYIGGVKRTHLSDTSWRTNKHYMRDLRWYNGYIPNQSERTQLYNHGLSQL